MSKLETLTGLLQKLRGADNSLYFEQAGDYVYLMKQGLKYNLCSDNVNDMAHFLKAFKQTRLKATNDNIENAHRVFGMAKSLCAYGRTSLKSILEDKYMNGDLYNGISQIAKRVIVNYLLNVVDETGYAGEDSEGGSYNYLTLVKAV